MSACVGDTGPKKECARAHIVTYRYISLVDGKYARASMRMQPHYLTQTVCVILKVYNTDTIVYFFVLQYPNGVEDSSKK